VPCELKIASVKAIWIAKSILASLESASHEAKKVLDYKTPLAPQLRLSCEAKALYAYNETTAAPLVLIILLGDVKPATCEAKNQSTYVC